MQLFFVADYAGAFAAQRERRAHHHRVSDLLRGLDRRGHGRYGLALRDLDVDFVEGLDKIPAVLGIEYAIDRRTENADIVFFEDAAFVQFDAAIQRGLAAEGEEYAIGALLGDDVFDERRFDGQKIRAPGHAFAGLDGGDVGIDEDGFDALFVEGLDGLAAGIVELAGLADLERAAAQQEDLFGHLDSGAFSGFF